MIINTSHPKFVDITGVRFSRLVALEISSLSKSGYIWRCVCDCGNFTQSSRYNLEKGRKRSCGCLAIESRKNNARHRSGGTPEYRSWRSMRQRCTDKNAHNYKYYGARGVRVSDEWLSDFNVFLADVGPRPAEGFTLDRINGSGNYEKGNVRWANKKTQSDNRKTTLTFEHDGRVLTISDMVVMTGLPHKLIAKRLAKGESVEQAMRPKTR